jgi:hypothetical protein
MNIVFPKYGNVVFPYGGLGMWKLSGMGLEPRRKQDGKGWGCGKIGLVGSKGGVLLNKLG